MNLYYTIKRKIIKQTLLNLMFVRFKCRKAWIGAPGCGFFVCPDILSARDMSSNSPRESRVGAICYSAGVGDDVSFDLALHEEFDIRELVLFDPTPMTIEWTMLATGGNSMMPVVLRKELEILCQPTLANNEHRPFRKLYNT
ncbi:MAG: hypothetical protein NWR51_06860 [Akkermansiaceae bacterium]|jgi:hypothetical protein|nr:hypothetical protein [Akkermansiaceae bacterium]MDP4846964.1 hypothetical protein [Akkermansiaceae bacterium]